MKSPSGPIRVFNDNTYVVEFVEGVPVTFTLTRFDNLARQGAYDPIKQEATFINGVVAVSTDMRVLNRAYDAWTAAEMN